MKKPMIFLSFLGAFFLMMQSNGLAVNKGHLLYLKSQLSLSDHMIVKSVNEKEGRAINLIADNVGGGIVPLESQAEINPDPDSNTEGKMNDGTQQNQTDTTRRIDSVTEGVVKSDPKPVLETSKETEPDRTAKKNEIKGDENLPVDMKAVDLLPQPVESSKSEVKLETVLTSISSWWMSNPLNMQVWYLFFVAGLALYLFKLKQLRRPLLFLTIIILGFYLGNSLDPIGAIFHLVPGTTLVFDMAIILLGIAIVLSLIWGRVFCGWICPLGAVQEFIHPEKKAGTLPTAMDSLLKYIKFLVLIIFLYLTWKTGENLWQNYEPLKVLVDFKGSSVALLVLVITIILSILIERPFCRFVCPLGAILSLTSRLAPFKMRSDATACMVCGKCTAGDCPMNSIDAYNPITDLPVIDSSECIYCLRCQKICQRSALRVSMRKIDRVQNR